MHQLEECHSVDLSAVDSYQVVSGDAFCREWWQEELLVEHIEELALI